MNEQEAMRILDELATFEYVQIEDGDTAIETIKYYVKKLEEEINDLKWKNEIYVKSIKSHKREIEKYKYLYQKALDNTIKADSDNLKKDKIIDEMANHIVTSDSNLCQYLDMTTKCKYYAGENKKTCDKCIKEYFINKVEKESENDSSCCNKNKR